MARPTDYDPTFPYLQKANEYLLTCGREQTKLPKVDEWCEEVIGINDDTGTEWCKRYPESEFTVAYKKILKTQKYELMDDGMFGGKEVNPAMAIFLLKNNHGMKDRSDQTTNDKDIPQPLLGGQAKDSV